METSARLIHTRAPKNPEGLVLVLHGGAARRETSMVSPTQLSVLRMVPIAHRIARAGRGRLAVVRLLNSTRGWDAAHTPVHDVRWALERLAERHGAPLPTCLVGHSLGGRAALMAGSAPEVASVVALNPWLQSSDRVDLGGRPALVVHGSEDRIADPRRALALATRLASTGPVSFLRVNGGRHSMLRHRAVFEQAAADFARATLLGDVVKDPVARLLNGTTELTV